MAATGMMGVPTMQFGQLTPGVGAIGGYGIAGQPFGVFNPLQQWHALPFQYSPLTTSISPLFSPQAAQPSAYALQLLQVIPQQLQQLHYLQQYTAQQIQQLCATVPQQLHQIQQLCAIVPQQLQQLQQLAQTVAQQTQQLQQQIVQQGLGVQPPAAYVHTQPSPWAWSMVAPGLTSTPSAPGFQPAAGQVM